MSFLRLYAILLPLVATISFLIVGCESKVSQCSKIIQVANRAVNDARNITNSGQTSDPKAILQAANAMDKAAKDMETLKVNDQKLKNYQNEFISMYTTTSKATRELVTAFQKKDRSAAETSLKNLEQATSPEKELVGHINTYCRP